ncbi:profilin [Syncephalastrum racemosum]|uniref:Profilin n=1 Tax=Syncephalastrum racemosum TaxID=13706 RepID=A0A1X2HJJ2_SYNRA|nr:profilin [Syncephalastrum racemosum]
MSWQQYVDSNLVGTGQVTKAAILGHNGSLWASSPGFNVQPNEAAELVEGFKDSEKIRATGIHLEGAKYLTLRADERSIYAKKGADGLAIVKTTQAIIVAYYKEGIQPGSCVKVVEGLADYLISVGY